MLVRLAYFFMVRVLGWLALLAHNDAAKDAEIGQPFTIRLAGASYAVGYEPGESGTGLFGGNARPGLVPGQLPGHRRAALLRPVLRRRHPHRAPGSGNKVTLTMLADDLARRLVSIFLDDARGRRPVFGDTGLFQDHPDWHDLLPFHEYFHGDTGRGLGASHQTGWTALVADLVIRTAGRGDGAVTG